MKNTVLFAWHCVMLLHCFHNVHAAPFILSTYETSATRLLKLLRQHTHEPRVVLNVVSRKEMSSPHMLLEIEDTLRLSVSHSVGVFSNYSYESAYSPALVPANSPVPNVLYQGERISVEASVRACSRILVAQRGNRSCFDKCK
jgi:hypothetical protein